MPGPLIKLTDTRFLMEPCPRHSEDSRAYNWCNTRKHFLRRFEEPTSLTDAYDPESLRGGKRENIILGLIADGKLEIDTSSLPEDPRNRAVIEDRLAGMASMDVGARHGISYETVNRIVTLFLTGRSAEFEHREMRSEARQELQEERGALTDEMRAERDEAILQYRAKGYMPAEVSKISRGDLSDNLELWKEEWGSLSPASVRHRLHYMDTGEHHPSVIKGIERRRERYRTEPTFRERHHVATRKVSADTKQDVDAWHQIQLEEQEQSQEPEEDRIAFSPEEAKQVGDDLKVDWNTISLDELTMGMNEEIEHSESLGTSSPITMAMIAIDHLEEDPQYYTKLKQMSPTPIQSFTIQRLPARRPSHRSPYRFHQVNRFHKVNRFHQVKGITR